MKRVEIIHGTAALRWVVRGPRRWDFHIWAGRSRTLRVSLGGPLI
jgi:hypothetical protein